MTAEVHIVMEPYWFHAHIICDSFELLIYTESGDLFASYLVRTMAWLDSHSHGQGGGASKGYKFILFVLSV